MPDFRVADSAPEHRKLRAAGLPAAGLWSMAGAWAMRELTDGWVPRYWVASWPGGTRHARTLVSVGLWRPEQRDGIPGYAFHDWPEYQRSAEQVEQERQKARDRMAAARARARPVTEPGPQSERSSPTRSAEHRANHDRTFDRSSSERAANVHDSLSLSLSPGGYVQGESSGEQTRARATSPQNTPDEPLTSASRPPGRCAEHAAVERDPGPCGGCAAARQRAERWDVERSRNQASQHSAQAHQRAGDREHAVAACGMCNGHGRLPGGGLCRHDPGAADRAQRGMALVRAALAKPDDETSEADE